MSDDLLVLHNGRILTMDSGSPEAQAVVIESATGRIRAVGSNLDVLTVSGPGMRRIDLRGRIVTPGFNDCHMHILPYGLKLAHADLSPAAGVRSVPELVAALRKWADENPNAEWIRGSRYDQNTFHGAAHPTRNDLDSAFPDRPVFVSQTSGHAGAANSVALNLAGITRDTPSPASGKIVRDSNGDATGVLLECAEELVTSLIPKPDNGAMAAAIRRANDELVRKGVTSASDLNTGWLNLEDEIKAYRKAGEQDSPVRMTVYPHAPVFGDFSDIPLRRSFSAFFAKGQSVRSGPIKLFADGALTTRTAALRERYVDSGTGMLLHEPEELKAYVHASHNAGWQVAIHAIGDRANELVLDAYAEAQAANPRSDTRHRIEHAMLLDDGLMRRFKEQSVLPVVQPEFVARLGDAYVLGLGEERAQRLNPTATLQRMGIPVPFSSDCPVVPGSPLEGIRAAVCRITPSGRILGENERISAMDALRNYTYWAAYSTFDEMETGRIMPGMRGDLTVLDGSLDDLDSLQVAATVIGGRIVHGELS